jgi:K+-sensing histidine kinase KdpD
MDAPIPVRRATGYVQATLACVATTVLTLPLRDVVDAANIVMICLLAVALVAVRLGSGPAILAAFGGVALFDQATCLRSAKMAIKAATSSKSRRGGCGELASRGAFRPSLLTA